MREIKFRAWSASEKEMVDWPHLLNDPDDWLLGLLNDPGEDVLMQFTGLKDKNGKEIYEGDIVQVVRFYPGSMLHDGEDAFDVTNRGCVHYRPSSGFMLVKVIEMNNEDCSPTWKKRGPMHKIVPSKSEVIGNIYENPELLSA
jgi:uncharacterized phage protein (TIGR01671 family)